MENKIIPEMLPAFQGIIPPTIASVSADGIPNVTYISQVHYVDEKHVAISRQFFNKTWRNFDENPRFTVALTCPESFTIWKLNLSFIEEKTEGSIFDEMDMIIKAIASMQGLEDVFKLRSAVICEVDSIQTLVLNGKIG